MVRTLQILPHKLYIYNDIIMNLIGLIGDMSICKLMICSKKNYIFNLTFKKKKN